MSSAVPAATAEPSRATMLLRIAVFSLAVVVVGAPAWPGSTDGFPLSTYPMFGYARSATSHIETALGVTTEGRRVPLRPWHIGGTAQAKHALSTARAAIRGGRASALCTEVARRVAEAPPPIPSTLVAIEVVHEAWNPLHTGPDAPAPRRSVHARCPIP